MNNEHLIIEKMVEKNEFIGKWVFYYRKTYALISN